MVRTGVLGLAVSAGRLAAEFVGPAKVWLGQLDAALMGAERVTSTVLMAVDRFNQGNFEGSPFGRRVFTQMELKLITVETGLAWRVGLLARSLASDEPPALFFGQQPFRFPALKFRNLATQVINEPDEQFEVVTSLDEPRLIVDAWVEGESYVGVPYVATRSLVVSNSTETDEVGRIVGPARQHFYTPVAPADFLDARLVVASVTPTDFLGFGSHLVHSETLSGLAAAAMANGYHYVRAEFLKADLAPPTVHLGQRLYQHYLAKLRAWTADVRSMLVAGGPDMTQLDPALNHALLDLDDTFATSGDPIEVVEKILRGFTLPYELLDNLRQVLALSVFRVEA